MMEVMGEKVTRKNAVSISLPPAPLPVASAPSPSASPSLPWPVLQRRAVHDGSEPPKRHAWGGRSSQGVFFPYRFGCGWLHAPSLFLLGAFARRWRIVRPAASSLLLFAAKTGFLLLLFSLERWSKQSMGCAGCRMVAKHRVRNAPQHTSYLQFEPVAPECSSCAPGLPRPHSTESSHKNSKKTAESYCAKL